MAVLSKDLPTRRFFASQIERMRYYERGTKPLPSLRGYYLSIDREEEALVVYSDGERFTAAWRPLRIMGGLWFWG